MQGTRPVVYANLITSAVISGAEIDRSACFPVRVKGLVDDARAMRDARPIVVADLTAASIGSRALINW